MAPIKAQIPRLHTCGRHDERTTQGVKTPQHLTRDLRQHGRFCRVDATDAGFTLIEILLTCSLIGVLSSIALPSLLGPFNRAKDNSVETSFELIVKDCTEALAFDDQTIMPANTDAMTVAGTCDINQTIVVTSTDTGTIFTADIDADGNITRS